MAEREALWMKFSFILGAMKIRAEEHLEDFNTEYETVKDLPFETQERAIEDLARTIVTKVMAPPPPVVKPPPPPPPVAPPVMPPVVPIPPPAVTTRYCKICGEPFLAPDESTLFYLQRLFPFPVDYYWHCEVHKRRHFGYPELHVLINEAIKYRRVEPVWWDWLRRLKGMLRGVRVGV